MAACVGRFEERQRGRDVRKYEIAPNLYYRWKDEVEAGAKAEFGGRSAAAQPDAEQKKHQTAGASTGPFPICRSRS